jgi:hypothetical protein
MDKIKYEKQIKQMKPAYKTWFDKYCDEHPEFDGYDDNAIDAFWNACEAAGFADCEDMYEINENIDDWFDVHGDQIIYDAAIQAGFNGDSINDWLDKRHTI